MPELPEVETTRLGIIDYAKDQKLVSVRCSHKKMRYPCDIVFDEIIGLTCVDIRRRAKYLIFDFGLKKILVHLGMSGSIRVEITKKIIKKKHDHYEFDFLNGYSLIFHDPRRFGFVVGYSDDWVSKMSKWGPEPLSSDFDDKVLYTKSKESARSIKQLLMDQHTVVGVGNIYANEVLFELNIHPLEKSCDLSKNRIKALVAAIKRILQKSIQQGGTTLRDFVSGQDKPGYFKQSLKVYGRNNEPCSVCNTNIERIMIGQRSSFYCPICQPLSVNK